MTLLGDVRPLRKVYLGLTADPYDALSTVTWTLIPDVRVKSVSRSWGAQHELGTVEPSRATVTLDNVDGDFETTNPAGPYYPDLRPLNRLRIVDTWDGDDYIAFTGYVVDWPRAWTGIGRAQVQLEAYDSLGAVLNAVDLPASPWELEVRNLIEDLPAGAKAVWLRLNESSGTVAADSSGFGQHGQYQGTPVLGVDGLTHDGDKAASIGTGSRVSLPYKNLITDYPWSFHCKVRAAINRGAFRALLTAFAGPSGDAAQLQIYIGPSDGKVGVAVVNPWPTNTNRASTIAVDDGLPHSIDVVMATSTSCLIYVDGVDVSGAGAAAAHAFPNDLTTGYAVGNTPAVAFGDYRLSFVDTDVIDEVVVIDGVALTAGEVAELHAAALETPDGASKSGMRLAAMLEALGWPAADTDIDDGLTTVQQGYVAGRAAAYAQRLAVTEGGRFFQAPDGLLTFHDRHRVLMAPFTVSQITFGEDTPAGEVAYEAPFKHGEDDADIHNDVRVANVGGAVMVARSKPSKDRYGWRTLSHTDLLGTSDEESQDRANRDLALYAEPVTRFRQIVVKPQADAAEGTDVWPALLGLGQSSRVTVKAQPPGAPMITQASHVEHLAETVTPDDWTVTLGLSAAQAGGAGGAWILGTSLLDSETRLSY